MGTRDATDGAWAPSGMRQGGPRPVRMVPGRIRPSRRARPRPGARPLLLAALAGALGTGGCELTEVSVAAPEPIVVAEVYFRADEEGGRGFALLHRSGGAMPRDISGAEVWVRTEDGGLDRFGETGPEHCLDSELPEGFVIACHRLPPEVADRIVVPGAGLDVEVRLRDGGRITGATRVPGAFEFVGPPGDVESCLLPPLSLLPTQWTPSAGAWAYLPEAEIRLEGFAAASVVLTGVAISESDTRIVFPSEFGVFQRFGEDREFLIEIQDGLPDRSLAQVVVAAADRNTVNWLRGGNFNPSGQVRIPSLFGDGTGVVGAAVSRSFRVEVGGPKEGMPDCRG